MAVLDEEDLDAVGGGWGEEDEMVGPGDDDADAEAGPRGEGDGLGGSEGDEEGGWEMEVVCRGYQLVCSNFTEFWGRPWAQQGQATKRLS